MPGKLTRPVKSAKESGAAKIGADLVAEMIDPGDTAETEAFPLQWAEEDALDAMKAHPELYYGSTAQKNRIRHELLKKAGETPAEPATAAASTPPGPAEEGESNLSKLAARIAADPETEGKLRSALNEIDQAAIDAAAVEQFYAGDEAEEKIDAWDWPTDEGAEGEVA